MRRRTVSILAVGLTVGLAVGPAVAGCSAGRPEPTGSPTSAAPSSTAPAQSPVEDYDLDEDDVAELGLPLQPVPAGQGALIGPGFTFRMTRVGTTTTFTAAQLQTLRSARTEPLTAPAGVEYLVVAGERFGLVGQSNGVEAVVFHVGDRTVKRSAVGTLLIVDAPTGAPVTLEVTSAGRTQRLDLRTGRGSQLVDGYYPVRSGNALVQCAIRITEPGVKLTNSPGNQVAVELRLSATMVPWLKDKGWAADGRRWLVVKPQVRLAALDADLSATTDLAADLTVTGAGGRLPIAGTAGTAGTGAAGGDNRAGTEHVFDVAADPAPLSVTFTFSGTTSWAGRPARHSSAGGAGCGKPNQVPM
jgi:hypothetical protein